MRLTHRVHGAHGDHADDPHVVLPTTPLATGALENLRRYGLTSTTLPYFARQLLIHIGILFLPFFLTVLFVATVQTGQFPWSWPWFFVSFILVVERVWTVRRGGRRGVVLAALIVPEILYDIFIHLVFVHALGDAVTGARANWDHREALQHQLPGAVARTVRTAVHLAIPIAGALIAASLALLASRIGIQWVIVGTIVGAGIAHSALRATQLDPMGRVFGSSENVTRDQVTALSRV